MFSRDEIKEKFDNALGSGDVYVCYQPQMNHITGQMIGAEALIRWEDPDDGFQSPADFIPVLEEEGLIFKADLFVFEEVCKLIKSLMEKGPLPVPISVNMSQLDITGRNSYVESIEAIRSRYNIPVKYLRIEITETFAIHGKDPIVNALSELHGYGYLVEMDDFGSGYSSLNILKDLAVDIIKLDMGFLRDGSGARGGAIMGSIMQMAKWLDTPVIAEGVETKEQADYMSSIGCRYIQGYLYSKPVKEAEFVKKLMESKRELKLTSVLYEDIDTGKFWDPDSMESLLFNSFVGPAVIFTYENGNTEIIRVNRKYIKELGIDIDETQILSSDPWAGYDASNRRIYEDTIQAAVISGDEEECETWRQIETRFCGGDYICIRSTMRVIGRAGDQVLFYATIRNVTAEKKIADNEKKFRMASDQNNTFAWEYTIATKEMRPCSRCMRVLGFPSLIKDYPEPAIADGTFPEDYADMYRQWHKDLADGARELEAIIPLTKDRIPFIVRYTAEFDEAGRPYKAYGSATMVVDSERWEQDGV